jgi:hypothetical protein
VKHQKHVFTGAHSPKLILHDRYNEEAVVVECLRVVVEVVVECLRDKLGKTKRENREEEGFRKKTDVKNKQTNRKKTEKKKLDRSIFSVWKRQLGQKQISQTLLKLL